MQSSSGAGASRCAISAAEAVLPITISPMATASAPLRISRVAISQPRDSAAIAWSRDIAGSSAASRVPRAIFAAIRSGCADKSAATPASITSSRAPVAAAKALALARPARNVVTIAAVTACG